MHQGAYTPIEAAQMLTIDLSGLPQTIHAIACSAAHTPRAHVKGWNALTPDLLCDLARIAAQAPDAAARVLSHAHARARDALTPALIVALARAAAQNPHTAAEVLMHAYERAWNILPTALIVALARAAMQSPRAASEVLTRAHERAWIALSPDLVFDLAHAASKEVDAFTCVLAALKERPTGGVKARDAIRSALIAAGERLDARRRCSGQTPGERHPAFMPGVGGDAFMPASEER